MRLLILLIAIVFPFALLARGVYGSFLFTFSVPLVWQVGLLGKGASSLGLKTKFGSLSIAAGTLTGIILGVSGGLILKSLSVTAQVFTDYHKLSFSIGPFTLVFPLRGELGYRLVTASGSLKGLILYILFSLFIIGLGEELFWRGFIQQKIGNRLSRNLSIWATAILFGLVHCYIFIILPAKTALIFIALIAIAGAIWGYLFERFGNVWCPAMSHGLAAFIIWKYFFFAKGL
jgi:membrane protease YdiL (CAAX protease family)